MFQKVGLNVQVSTKLNRSHLHHRKGSTNFALSWPNRNRHSGVREQFQTVEKLDGTAFYCSTGGLTPASPIFAEPWIVFNWPTLRLEMNTLIGGLLRIMTLIPPPRNGRYSVLMGVQCPRSSSLVFALPNPPLEGQSNFFNALRKGPIYDAPFQTSA